MYIVLRFVTFYFKLAFCFHLQTLSSCAHRPADLDGSKGEDCQKHEIFKNSRQEHAYLYAISEMVCNLMKLLYEAKFELQIGKLLLLVPLLT